MAGAEKTAPTKCLRIDMHTHYLPHSLPDCAARYGYGGFVTLDHEQSKVQTSGNARMLKDGYFYREVAPNLWDLGTRVVEMDRDGIDVQVLSTVPVMFNYWAKGDDTADLSRILNNDLKKQIDKHPKRFIGLGTLPMQAPELAVAELKRCINDLGFVGVSIGSHVNDWALDSPELIPFWECCDELQCCVFVHPWDMHLNKTNNKHMMPWIVGMPAETSQAVVSVVLGGLLERYPKLKICFAHGGGSYPYLLGRINQGFHAYPQHTAQHCALSPALQSFDTFYADCLVHSPEALQLLLSTVGNKRVLYGSDYPFGLGETRGIVKGVYPGKILEGLDEDLKATICERNALRFLGKKREAFR